MRKARWTSSSKQPLARIGRPLAEVRAKNTELRRKEREVVSAQLAENRRLREESITREHAERFQKDDEKTTQPPAPPDPDDEPEEVVYEKRPKKKRRVWWLCKIAAARTR